MKQENEDILLLEDMLDDSLYEYAADYLQDVLDQCKASLRNGGLGLMTKDQKEAIEEIIERNNF